MKNLLARAGLALALTALLSGCGTFWVLSHDFLAPEPGHAGRHPVGSLSTPSVFANRGIAPHQTQLRRIP